MVAKDPDLRRVIAAKASNARLGRLDEAGRRALTAKARAAQHARDLAAVDPDGTLSPAERERLAGVRRRLRMSDLAILSARQRQARSSTIAARDYERAKALLVEMFGAEVVEAVEAQLGERAA